MAIAGDVVRTNWQAEATCRGVDPDVFFPSRGESLSEPRAYCLVCPVASDCLRFNLHERQGVFAGLSERERRRARKWLDPTGAYRPPMITVDRLVGVDERQITRPSFGVVGSGRSDGGDDDTWLATCEPSSGRGRQQAEQREAAMATKVNGSVDGHDVERDQFQMKPQERGDQGERATSVSDEIPEPAITWDEAVERGRRMVGNLGQQRWSLGDLALLVSPMGTKSVRRGEQRSLRAFAAAIGCEHASLLDYRATSSAWRPQDRRSEASWSAHRWLIAEPERVQLLHTMIAASPTGRVTMADLRSVVGSRRRALSLEGLEHRLQRLEDDLLAVAEPGAVARMLRAHAERLEERAVEVA